LPDSAPPFPTQVVADINGDGMDDLVLGDSPEIELYISAGRQGFMQDQALIVNGYGVTLSSLTVADFNGDGLLDIAAGMIAGDDVVLFTNDGTGKYQVTSYAIGVNSVSSITSDFNHDGKPDLAFRGYLLLFEPPTVTVLLHQ
jgi:FG-GAP-like repeat